MSIVLPIGVLLTHVHSDGGRTLTVGIAVTGAMTVDLCTSACQTQGYTLAGMEYSSQCCKHPLICSKYHAKSNRLWNKLPKRWGTCARWSVWMQHGGTTTLFLAMSSINISRAATNNSSSVVEMPRNSVGARIGSQCTTSTTLSAFFHGPQ